MSSIKKADRLCLLGASGGREGEQLQCGGKWAGSLNVGACGNNHCAGVSAAHDYADPRKKELGGWAATFSLALQEDKRGVPASRKK
jgi:hypothetical protein